MVNFDLILKTVQDFKCDAHALTNINLSSYYNKHLFCSQN